MDDSSKQDERVMTIVATALKLGEGEREPFLRATCGTDEQLYEETTEAIEWEQRMGGFLQEPMVILGEVDRPFAPSEIIAERFEIIRQIGEGGMGVVYEALDRKRNQRIAIKAAKPGFGRLLSPELEGALRVRHPNVCLVNEIHSTPTAEGDVDFLTMELLEGETLSARLARDGKMAADEARHIARQLCAGLQEAHRSGVIHRDLKAGNVILCRDGRAVITDFGLSGEAGRSGFFGSQRYMAPELVIGKKASCATDIFALGVILYEMAEKSAGPATRPFQKLMTEFLSLEPDRRLRAFASAQEQLARTPYSRRQMLGAGLSAACALAGVSWLERERIENLLQPLPRKRFVALLAWPPDMDVHLKPTVSGAVDAIESELARAEAADHDLFVFQARDSINPREKGWLGKLGESLGVNMALQASGVQTSQEFGLMLKLLDISTGVVLRQHQIVCRLTDVGLLAEKAVQAAAGLLNVRWDGQGLGRLRPSTDSVIALQAFQAAEELRKKPNDDGLNDAIESYKKAIDTDPQYAAAYARLAMAYYRLNYINANPAFLELAGINAEKAIQLDPKSANGHLALANVFKEKGNLDEALKQIRAATQMDPTNPRNWLYQGQIYDSFNRWKEAEESYRRFQQERVNYWVAYNELGRILTIVGRYKDAIKAFQTACALAPKEALALSNLGMVQFKVGNLAQAEQSIQSSLTAKPSASAYLNRGEALRVKGRFADAVASYKDAIKYAPADDQGWFGIADCYEAMGHHEKLASDAFQKAAAAAELHLQRHQRSSSCWMRLALYRIKGHSARDSRQCLERAEESGPLEVDSAILKARILELYGERKHALETVEWCLRLAPVRFEIENIKDLGALTKDPGYARTLKLVAQGEDARPVVSIVKKREHQ